MTLATAQLANPSEQAIEPPVVIVLGVPRSGTTLLRVLLGSHPEICASCETPWICGGYGSNSLRHLTEHLDADPLGPVANMTGISAADVLTAAREFVKTILRNYRQRTGKARVLLKTPDDMAHLEFLIDLFPHADVVHICRDGRDVACSTVAQKGKLLGTHIAPYGEISFQSALRRWSDWEGNARRAIAGGAIARAISCRYEDLVTEPEQVLRKICGFIGVDYSPTMFGFARQTHDLPQWEAGAQDVRGRPTISPASVGKWKTLIPAAQFAALDEIAGEALEDYGYRRCRDEDVEFPDPPAATALARVWATGSELARAGVRRAAGIFRPGASRSRVSSDK